MRGSNRGGEQIETWTKVLETTSSIFMGKITLHVLGGGGLVMK